MSESEPTPLPDEWERGTIESNGIDLHYVRTGGEGPPLVVAHGVFDDAPAGRRCCPTSRTSTT